MGQGRYIKRTNGFAEATSVLPLIASDAYHRQNWKNRERRNFQKLF